MEQACFFFKLISARGGEGVERRWMIKFLNANIISFAKVNKGEG